jgi:hypothetical protein
MNRYAAALLIALLLPLGGCLTISAEQAKVEVVKVEEVSLPRQRVATLSRMVASTRKGFADDYTAKVAVIMVEMPVDSTDRKARVWLAGEPIRKSEAPLFNAEQATREAGDYLSKAANYRSLSETRDTEADKISDQVSAAAAEKMAIDRSREAETHWKVADALLSASR